MILDWIITAAIALGEIVITAVNTAWSALDMTGFFGALIWFQRLDRWVPVAHFFLILAVLCTLASMSLVIKMGIKCIDWIRG